MGRRPSAAKRTNSKTVAMSEGTELMGQDKSYVLCLELPMRILHL